MLSADQWVHLGVSALGALLMGFGVYVGHVRANAKIEGRMEKIEGRVEACEKNHGLLDQRFYEHVTHHVK